MIETNYKEHLSHPIFQIVSDVSNQENIKCSVIGGFVRDLLLNRPNKKDIDFVVEGDGVEFAKKIAFQIDPKLKVHVFKTFGTAHIKLNDIDFEFVGARKESYNPESRKPEVDHGTIKDDQERRDFTINALSISLDKENYGNLIDPFNGVSDLENAIIRTPLDPDITFSDDPLRMMRAVRFSTELGFEIESETFKALTTNKDRIKIVSKERIVTELNKIINAPVPSIGFYSLFHSGILKIIFPEMVDLCGVDVRNNKKHKDNFIHTLQVLDNVAKKSDDLWLRWSAILHDIAKPATKRFDHKAGWTFHGHEDKGARMVPNIFRSLKLPLDNKMKFVQKMVLLHLRPIALTKDTVTDSGVRRLLFDAGEDIDKLMILCNADITSKNERKVKKYLENFNNVRQKLKVVEEKDEIRNWQPPISGQEIMKYFGINPCKEVGVIKNAIKEAILDGEIDNNKISAFEFMKTKGKELGLKLIQTA